MGIHKSQALSEAELNEVFITKGWGSEKIMK